MANVTTDQIRELREKTGAGIMECKKALTESGGKMDDALHILRVKGAKIADERPAGLCAAERSAATSTATASVF